MDESQFALEYEIAGAGWPSFIFWRWGQNVVAWYFGRRVRTKLRRLREYRRVRASVARRGEA